MVHEMRTGYWFAQRTWRASDEVYDVWSDYGDGPSSEYNCIGLNACIDQMKEIAILEAWKISEE